MAAAHPAPAPDAPYQHRVAFSIDGLVAASVICLQNGGDAIVQLTSDGESSYFSKLVSSFW
jgi:hypothetical protein